MYLMPVFERIYWTFIGLSGRFLIWLLGVSARKTVLGEKPYIKLRKSKKPVIFILWHGRILFASYLFRKRGITALVSPSRDGEIIARIASGWGYKLLRGSGSHPVVDEWKKMKKLMNAGGELIIVADGPKGPARKMKPGAVRLAQETGAYLVPFTYSSKKGKFFKSWDRFLFFYPFTKVAAVYGMPIKINSDLKPDEFERERLIIEGSLRELEEQVEESF